MSDNPVRILRAAKDTRTRAWVENGAWQHTLLDIGAGTFLAENYDDAALARKKSVEGLARDPYAIFYVVKGNEILDTVLDHAHQHQKRQRAGLIYAIFSTVAVAAASLCVSVFVLGLPAPFGHAMFAAGMTLLYVLLLRIVGTGNIESLIMIVILLVLVILVAPTIRKYIDRGKAPNTMHGLGCRTGTEPTSYPARSSHPRSSPA